MLSFQAFFRIHPFRRKTLQSFYRNLSKKLSAGIPAIEALELSAPSAGSFLRPKMELLLDDLRKGYPFWEAASRAPDLFPEPYPRLVRAGEEGGSLPATLELLARDLDDQASVWKKLASLSLYPAAVLFIWLYVFPVTNLFFDYARTRGRALGGLDKGYGDYLFLYAKGTLGPYVWIAVKNTFGLFLAGFLAWLAFRLFKKWTTPERRYRLLGNLPFAGPMVRKLHWSTMASLLSRTLSAGMLASKAVALAARATGNPLLEKKGEAASRRLAGGEPLAASLAKEGLFPPEAFDTLRTAEITGSLDEALGSLGERWRREVVESMDRASFLSGKIMLILLAVAVLFLVGSQYFKYLDFVLKIPY